MLVSLVLSAAVSGHGNAPCWIEAVAERYVFRGKLCVDYGGKRSFEQDWSFNRRRKS